MRLRLPLALFPLLVCLASPRAQAQVTNYAYVPATGTTSVDIIDVAAWTPVSGSPLAGVNASHFVATTPDGSMAFIASINGQLSVIDVATQQLVSAIPMTIGLQGLAVSPDSRLLYIANTDTDSVSVRTLPTLDEIGVVSGCDGATGVAVSPDGTKAFVTCALAGTVMPIVMTEDGPAAGLPIPVDLRPIDAVFSQDGLKLFVSNALSNTVSVVDAVNDVVTTSIAVQTGPKSLSLSPDGEHVYVACDDAGVVTRIHVATEAAVGPTFSSLGLNPRGMRVTPDGSRLIIVNGGSAQVQSMSSSTGTPTAPPLATGFDSTGFGSFLTPNILIPAGSPLDVSDDADFRAKGFRRFVPFNGGELRLLGNLNADTLSLLQNGGTIDTTDKTMTVANTVNSGRLIKRGTGDLFLNGVNAHTGGTQVDAGRVVIAHDHPGTLTVNGGHLALGGDTGQLQMQGGSVNPGYGAVLEITAAGAQFTNGAALESLVYAAGNLLICDRLRSTTPVQLTSALLTLSAQNSLAALPVGASCTLITGGTVGEFTNMPEGAIWQPAPNGPRFQITYLGGDSNTDVVITLVADAAPIMSAIPDQTIVEDTTLGPIDITVSDDFTPAADLVLTASSSNQALLPDGAIVLGGANGTRTLTATPTPGATGETLITLTLSDGSSPVNGTRTFTLTVVPLDRSYFFAEGATGTFFNTEILIANPNETAAPVTLRFTTGDGNVITHDTTVAALSRRTFGVDGVPGLHAATFATEVISTEGLPLAVERTMWWDPSRYGAHTERASEGPAAEWHFAEGAQGFFATYYLLANPSNTPNAAHITWYREDGVTVTRDYDLPVAGRTTVDAGDIPELATQAFSARVTFDQPGLAERAMYFGAQPAFSGGAAAAGVTTPSTSWYFAEGATGSFFTTFLLISNPNEEAASVEVAYLGDGGAVIATRTHEVGPHQRRTIDVAGEAPELAAATFAARMTATHPIIAERSQYWPTPSWQESHSSAGVTAPATAWGLAEGHVGGAGSAQTFILLGNPGDQPAEVTVTLLREADGAEPLTKTFNVPAQSRRTIAIAGIGTDFPELADETFGARITSTQPIIVERSLYTSMADVMWISGTNATGTPLPEE